MPCEVWRTLLEHCYEAETAYTQALTNSSDPFRFRVIKTVETKNYSELERAFHSLLDPYRVNRSREFFTDHCLQHVEQIITLHASIQQDA